MKKNSTSFIAAMLLIIATYGQQSQLIPLEVVQNIADRNAQANWGDVYPAEPIPYYGYDDEIIAWRFNYSIGKPFPEKEQLLTDCIISEEKGDKHGQWGAGNYSRFLIGARKTIPVIIEKTGSLSPEFAEAPKMQRLLNKAFGGQQTRLLKVYYFNHFETWYEYESAGEVKYINISPSGGIIDKEQFLAKKQSATWFIQPDDFSKDWDKYEKGFSGGTDELKVIPNLAWMPYYDWSYGCTPTAAAMLLSWWDYNSYNTDYKYAGFVNRHYQRFDDIEDETDYNVPDLQLHLALAMGTDTTDGSTWPHLMDNGYQQVCNDERHYDFSIGSYYTMWWTHVTDEIDAGRPVHIDISGHSICGVGYDADEDLVLTRYTWDPENTYINRYTMLHIVTVHPGGPRGDAVSLLRPFGDPRYNNDGEGEVVYGGDYFEITWRADKYFSTTTVDLLYSLDGGYSYNVIALDAPNSGFYNWNVPAGFASNACRVIVVIHDTEYEPYNAASDGSYGNFIIQTGGSVPQLIDGDVHTSEDETDFYRFTENSTSWATVATFPQDPACGWGCELWDEDFQTQLAASATWNTGNFVVLDGNHLSAETYGIKAKPQSCTTACDVQYEDGDEILTLTPGASVQFSWDYDNLIDMKDIHLVPGQYYFEMHRLSGAMDLDIALFSSSGGDYYQTLDDALAKSTNDGSLQESFVVTIVTEDDYGICFFAKERGSGMYAVKIDDAFIWEGYESNDWHNPDNWSGHTVPDLMSKVVIPPTADDPVITNGEAFCGELSLLRNAVLTISSHNLMINGNLINNGEISIFSPTSRITCHGDVSFSTYGDLSMAVSSGMYVYGNWTFGEGSSVHLSNGFVDFQGTENSLIYIKSDDSWFYDLKISKTDDAWVAYDNCPGLEPLRIKNQFVVYDDATFIQFAMFDVILEGTFLSYPGSQFQFQYGTVRFERHGSGGFNVFSESGSYFNDIVVSVNDWLGLSSNIEIRGDLLLEQGMFTTQGYDVYIKGNWYNNSGFGHDNSRVIFNGTGTQEVTGSNFWELELNKPSGELRVHESTVSVQHYDWAQGTIRVNGGWLQLNDLEDPGIYGTVILTSGQLDYRQDPGEYLDLNGNLQISGGEMNIIGGNGLSYWPFAANATFTMSDGVLDFNTFGLRIHNSTTYSLTENITGGVIKINGDLNVARTDFNAAGGTIYFYGYTEDATVSVASGSNLYNLELDKSSKKSKALAKTLTASGTLDLNGDFIITGGNFEAPTKMYVGGNFINTQSPYHFDELTGEVVLDGSVDQVFNQEETFYKLTINKPGDGTVTVANGIIFSVLNTLLVDRGNMVFDPGSSLMLDGNFDVNYLGNIYFDGEAGNEISVTSASKSRYGFDVSGGGYISANNTSFNNMDADGIYLHSGCYVDSENAFSECTFSSGAPGGTLITWDNGAEVVVHNAIFPTNTSGCTFNVKKTTNSGRVFFDEATGPFAGETFESDPFSRIDWEYIPPLTIPFTENWNSSSFTTNHWVPEGTNWQISGTQGQPFPTAFFNYSPRISNYAVPLRSHLIDGTDFNSISVKFDIRYVNYSSTTLEQLTVQVVHKNGDFITLDTYNNSGGSFGFVTKEFDVSDFADGEIFYLRFTAFGADSWNIDGWFLDNIIVSGTPPEPGKIGGFVTDLVTGLPIKNATVVLDGSPYSALTDETGEYIIINIIPGTYSATVSATGYEPAQATGIVVVSGETTFQNFALNPIPPVYCTEFLYNIGCTYGDGFDTFQLAEINNSSSGCSPFGYGDFTGMTATLSRGYPYALSLSSNYSLQYVSVWVDFNDDFEFSISEKIISDLILEIPGELYTNNFTIPETAATGIHRLRARTNWNETSGDACSTYEFGETEDYSIIITSTQVTSSLRVFVVDGVSKGAIENAMIEIVGTNLIGYTEEEGICIISGIVPGSYDIQVTADNYEDLLLADQMIYAKTTRNLEAILTPLTLQTQIVTLGTGWQGLSSYLLPATVNIENIFAPIYDELVIVSNFVGFYWPDMLINTLGTWKEHAAFFIKVNADAELLISGYDETNKTVNLNEGWTLMPVVSNTPVEVADLMAPVAGDLFIIKEIAGIGVYWPGMAINTLIQLNPGKAYLVLSNADCSVTFPENPETKTSSYLPAVIPSVPGWSSPVATASSHTVAIPFNVFDDFGFEKGNVLGVFTNNGICAGKAIIEENTVLTIFADDPITREIEGFTEGETMNFMVATASGIKEIGFEFDPLFPDYSGTFIGNGISVAKAAFYTGILQNGGVFTKPVIYPNPGPGLFNISIAEGYYDVKVVNSQGHKVFNTTVNSDQKQLDLRAFADGVYFVSFTSNTKVFIEKLVIFR